MSGALIAVFISADINKAEFTSSVVTHYILWDELQHIIPCGAARIMSMDLIV